MHFNDRRVILTVTTAASLLALGAIGAWSRGVRPARAEVVTIDLSASAPAPAQGEAIAVGPTALTAASPVVPPSAPPKSAAVTSAAVTNAVATTPTPTRDFAPTTAPVEPAAARTTEVSRAVERVIDEPVIEAPCSPAPAPPTGVVDTFNSRDAKGWWFGNNQQIPFVDCSNPVVRSIGSGFDWAGAMSRPETFGPGATFSLDFRVDNSDSQFHVGVTTPDYRNRLVLLVTGGRLAVQTQRNDVWTIATQFAFEPNAWYRGTFRVETSGAISVELENVVSHVRSTWSEPMPTGLTWRFLQGVLHGTALLDNYVERVRPIVPLATRDLIIYGDSLSPMFRDVSLFTRLARHRTIPKRVGANSLGVSFQQPTSRLVLGTTGDAIRASNYLSLRFWIFATGGGAAVDISVIGDGIESNKVTVAVAPDQWNEVTVPLAALNPPASIERIVVANSAPLASTPFFLDELRLSIAPAVAFSFAPV
jgi:hypothetical protein